MRVEPASGRVLGGPLVPVYVYEAPVRFWHWATMTAFAVLAVTGYLIGSPWPSTAGEAFASFSFGYVRMAHEISGYLLAVLFLVRVYWAFAGNHHARAIFLPPIFNGKWWRGLFRQMGYYLFLREESRSARS